MWALPRIHTVHQVYDEGDAADPRQWRRLSILNEGLMEYCRSANQVVAVSPEITQRLEDGGCSNVVTIPNAVDFNVLQSARPARARARFRLPAHFVVSIAHSGPVKNPRLFVELARALPSLSFVVIGVGLSVASLRAAGIEPPGNLTCLGHLPHHDVLDVLSTASVFVLPSLREGFPIAALEALGLRVPSVLPDLSATRQLAEGGRIALLYPPGNLEEAKRALLRAIERPPDVAEAERSCRERFSWDVVARKIDSLYEEVTGR